MIFKCNSCGGNVVYSPEKEKMFCPHCEGLDTQAEMPAPAIDQCPNCGAPMNISEYTSASKCEHCGSYIIFDKRVTEEYKPNLILPFKVGKNKAAEFLKKEFGKRIFTPSSFLSEATLQSMEGMYVPFWLYDFYAHIDYEGKGTKLRVWRVGNREFTETSIFSVQRNMTVDFDKIPVDASNAMDDKIMDLMEPYEYQALENFQEKYMSGYFGERFNQDAMTLENRAASKARNDSESLLQESLGGYTTLIPVKKDIQLERDVLHYALMPVWVYNFSYRGKVLPFYINGQTGKIIGNSPVSTAKVFSYGLTLWVAVTILGFILKTILEVL